jgi:hypothetical protein
LLGGVDKPRTGFRVSEVKQNHLSFQPCVFFSTSSVSNWCVSFLCCHRHKLADNLRKERRGLYLLGLIFVRAMFFFLRILSLLACIQARAGWGGYLGNYMLTNLGRRLGLGM